MTKEMNIFGLPSTEEKASVSYLPVPWEATTSYGKGTAHGPEAIFKASSQLDLWDPEIEKPFEAGLFFQPISKEVLGWNEEASIEAEKAVRLYEKKEAGLPFKEELYRGHIDRVNQLSEKLNRFVYEESKAVLEADRILGVVGGDHSVPFGAIQAMAEKIPEFGILHFDAHFDLRKAYQGFEHSHASIMYNVLENIPQVKNLVQVGIRDYSEEELQYANHQQGRVATLFDTEIAQRKIEGIPFAHIAKETVEYLPQAIWVSFDIDGLDPKYCPNTGTPVPGGISFHEANYLIGEAVKSGRRIIGFDLNEVSPSTDTIGSKFGDEWDANVGMRLLYKLTGWMLASQGKAKLLR